MGEFASKGVAGSGLGLGIAGTALGVLNSGVLNGGMPWLMGGNCANRGYGYGYMGDVGLSEALAQRDAEIARLQAKAYSDESDLAIYKYFDGKLEEINKRLCEQAVFNATANGTMSVLASQINELKVLTGSITRTAVPKSAICDFDAGCGCGVSTT